MPNNQRRTFPGPVNKPTAFNKTALSNQPRVVRAQPVPPRPPQPPHPPRPNVQLKQARQVSQIGPHINQHSAHLQRTVQMKMGHPHAANRFVSPAIARPAGAGVVQPACIADFFKAAWRKISSCWSSSQYEELPDRGGVELRQPVRQQPQVQHQAQVHYQAQVHHQPQVRQQPQVRVFNSVTVDQEETRRNLAYPSRVDGGLITSCALVFFCSENSFDCYHASAGHYSASHGMRGNPARIYYVYMSAISDTRETIAEYDRHARLFRASGGNAPMVFKGQTGLNRNIMVELMSATEIGPGIGQWV